MRMAWISGRGGLQNSSGRPMRRMSAKRFFLPDSCCTTLTRTHTLNSSPLCKAPLPRAASTSDSLVKILTDTFVE